MIYFLLLVVFIAFGILKKNSKIIFLCIYVILFLASVYFSEGHDLSMYKDGYEQRFVDEENVEMYRSVFFASIVFVFNLLGFTFFQFRIFCFVLWSSSAALLINKYAKYKTLVFAICAFYPLLSNASLIKNGLMASLVYLAFYYIVKRHDFCGKLIYVVLILIAAYLHNTAFCYLLGVLAICRRFSSVAMLRIAIVFSLISIFLLQSGLLFELLSLVVSDYYADMYFSKLDAYNIGNIHFIIGILINVWFSFHAERIELKYSSKDNPLVLEFSRFVKRMNILMLFFIPLLIVSVTFYRIYLNLLLLTVISVTNATYHYDLAKNNKGLFMRFSFLLVYYVEVFLYYLGQGTFFEFWNSIVI